jgi:hypothetical protein
MPITISELIEDSLQADGRRWITEQHTAATGKTYRVNYLAESSTDVNPVMIARVPGINQSLIDTEIAKYLDRVEQGLNTVGLPYTETVIQYRVLQFILWLKENVKVRNFDTVQWAYLVTDPHSEAQINGLLVGTEFEGKADVIKLWTAKIKDMKLAMDDAETAGEVV